MRQREPDAAPEPDESVTEPLPASGGQPAPPDGENPPEPVEPGQAEADESGWRPI